MLTSRIHVPPPPDPKPEDIFQSSLTALFKDDTQNSHGNPGDRLFYRSPLYGDITIHLPEHPYLDSNRRLFAHYLWNAGVLVADTIERASNRGDRVIETESEALNSDYWNVKGERVLELGAGS
jgi:EEF1A N-terminal glycine/lysine methyltransferase